MFKKELPIITIGLSIVVAVLVLSWAVFIKPTPVALVQAPAVSDDLVGDDENDEIVSDDVSNEFFTYVKDNQKFSVSKSEFKILNKFDALELKSKSEDCGTNKSEQYFKQLLSHYSEDDNGAEFQFKYLKPSQDSGIWTITVIPNTIGYTKLEDFKNDFDLCEVGSNRYPALMSDKYLLFVSSCGTGFDDDSGLPHGCDVIKEIVEPTIKFDIDITDWQNYTESNYGFAIKYPAEWILDESNEGLEEQLYRIFFKDNNNQNNWFNIDIFDNSTDLSLDQYLTENKFYTQDKSKKNVIIGDITGLRFTYFKNFGDYIESEDVTFVFYNKKIIRISLSIDSEINNQARRNQIQEILDKIISTFEFIK